MRADSGRIVRYCIRHQERSTSRCIVIISPSISAINPLTTSPLVNPRCPPAHRTRSIVCSVAEGPLCNNEKEGNTCLLIFTIPWSLKDFPKRDDKRASAAAWAHGGFISQIMLGIADFDSAKLLILSWDCRSGTPIF